MCILRLWDHLNISVKLVKSVTQIFYILIDILSFILSHTDKGVLKYQEEGGRGGGEESITL